MNYWTNQMTSQPTSRSTKQSATWPTKSSATRSAKQRITFLLALLPAALVASLVMFSAKSSEAQSRVPFVRECQGRDPGTWMWGEGSDGCDAHRFGNVSRIKFVYQDFVFDRNQAKNDDHRKEYVTNMNALLRDLATQYIKSRRSDVQDDEVDAFVNAIHAVAHQETYWSHYRRATQGGLKLATGDRNISHGIMQINQRYHASRETDRSFDLVGNASFGIEHYYSEWESARGARCIQRVKNQKRSQTLENIARAAYSSYNGGPGAICRWANPRHKWAKNDKNYFQKLKGRDWSAWVNDPQQKLAMDLNCVRSGDEFCAVAKERRGEFLTHRALVFDDGANCVTTDGQTLYCAKDHRVFTCLAGLSSEVAKNDPIRIKDTDTDVLRLPRKFYDNRLDLCQAAFPTLAVPGDMVTTKVALAIKNEIGGKTVGFTKKGQSFQVLDLEFEEDAERTRYYRVRLSPKVEGWISAGTEATHERLTQVTKLNFAAPSSGVTAWLPVKGRSIEIAKVDGTRLLSSPENAGAGPRTGVKAELPVGSKAVVEDVLVTGAANEIWLKVRTGLGSDSDDNVGFVYAGRTYPSSTVDEWVKVK